MKKKSFLFVSAFVLFLGISLSFSINKKDKFFSVKLINIAEAWNPWDDGELHEGDSDGYSQIYGETDDGNDCYTFWMDCESGGNMNNCVSYSESWCE